MKHPRPNTFILLSILFAASVKADWKAYNDSAFKPGQVNAPNVTTFGIGRSFQGEGNEGDLLNLETGLPVGIHVSFEEHISTGSVNNAGDAAQYAPGSDAESLFGGIVDISGNISYGDSPGWWVDLVIEGLDPIKFYTFAATANRNGGAGYADRVTNWTLMGADSSQYASSEGAHRVHDASVEFSTGDNSRGLVAKWVDIRAGSDGTITIRTSHTVGSAAGGMPGANSNKGYAGGVFMLVEQPGSVQSGPKPAEIISLHPPRDATEAHPNTPILVSVKRGDYEIDSGSIHLKLDGVEVNPTISTAEDVTLIEYRTSSMLPSSSRHSVELGLQESGPQGRSYTESWSFQVLDYSNAIDIPSNLAKPASAVIPSARGFAMKIISPSENDFAFISTMEEAIAIWDLNVQNIIDPSIFNGFGYFIESDTVNYQIDGRAIGTRSSDRKFPGVPGSESLQAMFALESASYLNLQAGFYRMYVTMRDGFLMFVGEGTQEIEIPFEFAPCTNCGGDDAPWIGDFLITRSGYYPFRLLFYSAAGGASLEWAVSTPSGGRLLINEDGAYAAASYLPPGTYDAPTVLEIKTTGNQITISWTGNGRLQNAPNANGPWSDIPNPAQPYQTTTQGNHQFYRVKQ